MQETKRNKIIIQEATIITNKEFTINVPPQTDMVISNIRLTINNYEPSPPNKKPKNYNYIGIGGFGIVVPPCSTAIVKDCYVYCTNDKDDYPYNAFVRTVEKTIK